LIVEAQEGLISALKSAPLSADGSDMDISAIAIQGIDQAQAQLENVATTLANAASNNGGNLDVVDLSAEVVALMSAKVDFSANLAVAKTASQIDQQVTNLIA
jgi:hypothetical protein